jgi:hypothetical protein
MALTRIDCDISIGLARYTMARQHDPHEKLVPGRNQQKPSINNREQATPVNVSNLQIGPGKFKLDSSD